MARRRSAFSRRFLIAGLALALFLVADVVLFGWLLLRSLSQREVDRALVDTKQRAEQLAQELAGKAKQQGDDLYTAVADRQERLVFKDSELQQKDIVLTVEIVDREGRRVFWNRSESTTASSGEVLSLSSAELPPQYDIRTSKKRETYDVPDVYDLAQVPIEDLGQIRIGISRDELERRTGELRKDLQGQAMAIGLVTFAALLCAYLIVWWLLRRGQELEEQTMEAERMAYLGTLAAGLAHEIRNPLNSLNLNMQMMEEELGEGGPPITAQRLLGITRGEIGRLERLVTDFLAFARPRPLELERWPAVDLLRHVRDLLDGELRSRAVQVELVDLSDGVEVAIDRGQIGQLLLNLAHNALAAMEDHPTSRLTLRAVQREGQVVLEVQDSGAGIAEADREKIFEVFYSTRKGGTGLGLAIARRIAEAHGGSIEVDSRVGGGTSVRLLLPPAENSEDRRTTITGSLAILRRDGALQPPSV